MCERDGSPLEQVEQVLAGRYVLKSVIGSGNMGTVYRATQLPMGRDVAVKLMHSDLVRNPDLVERFEREAQAAATVDHPNAITVFDSGRTSDGQVYISMELLEGESLSAMIDREIQIPPERALELWIPVVKAMVVAHRKGVIHRDRTPPSIPSRNENRTELGKRCERSGRPSSIDAQSRDEKRAERDGETQARSNVFLDQNVVRTVVQYSVLCLN